MNNDNICSRRKKEGFDNFIKKAQVAENMAQCFAEQFVCNGGLVVSGNYKLWDLFNSCIALAETNRELRKKAEKIIDMFQGCKEWEQLYTIIKRSTTVENLEKFFKPSFIRNKRMHISNYYCLHYLTKDGDYLEELNESLKDKVGDFLRAHYIRGMFTE